MTPNMEKNEILVMYGDKPEEMAYRTAKEAGLAELIGDRGKRIGLKPNLVVARPADEGATTHPEIARGIIGYLKENGFKNIAIIEGSWAGSHTREAFPRCGYTALASELSSGDIRVELIDTQTDTHRSYDCKGMRIEICDSALAVDFMINLPVMKGHCQTLITCALKNNKGVIPNSEKRRFHTIGLHRPIAHLNTIVKNDFILVDGICGDPDFEEGGGPVTANRVFAARDPVLCDAWAAAQMGYAAQDIPYIGFAEKLGVGSADLDSALIREISAPENTAPPAVKPLGKARRLAAYINENNACSACYAALVFALSRLNERELGRLPGRICVGQGFAGKSGGIGAGKCTAAFGAQIGGCPPSGAAILEFLRRLRHTGKATEGRVIN
jgi:uncharacterized protein (DUF362 family)